MATHKVQTVLVHTGGTTTSTQKTYTGSTETSVSESVADATTDGLIVYTLDVSACKSFYINSSVAVTVETNSGSVPDDTLSLVANKPYQWDEDSYDTFLLGTDVTGLYITNASGSAATITVYSIADATP